MITYWKLDTQWTRIDETAGAVVHVVHTDKSWFIYSSRLSAEEIATVKAVLLEGAEMIDVTRWEPVLKDAQLHAANL